MAMLYISDKGSDDAGNGTEQKPLKTLLKVIDRFNGAAVLVYGEQNEAHVLHTFPPKK